MERIGFNKKNQVLVFALIVVTSILGPRAFSGVSMLETRLSESDSDGYPLSRFGQRPSDPTSKRKGGVPFSSNEQPARGLASLVESGDKTDAQESKLESKNEFMAVNSFQRGVQELSLIVDDVGFFPKVLFTTQGIAVRLFVTSSSRKNTLCFMLDPFQVRREIKIGKIEEIVFTPKAPGQYRYYCPVNGGEGFLVVREPPLR